MVSRQQSGQSWGDWVGHVGTDCLPSNWSVTSSLVSHKGTGFGTWRLIVYQASGQSPAVWSVIRGLRWAPGDWLFTKRVVSRQQSGQLPAHWPVIRRLVSHSGAACLPLVTQQWSGQSSGDWLVTEEQLSHQWSGQSLDPDLSVYTTFHNKVSYKKCRICAIIARGPNPQELDTYVFSCMSRMHLTNQS